MKFEFVCFWSLRFLFQQHHVGIGWFVGLTQMLAFVCLFVCLCGLFLFAEFIGNSIYCFWFPLRDNVCFLHDAIGK